MKFVPAKTQTDILKKYEDFKFGVFVHFNMQQFVYNKQEFTLVSDPKQFNPTELDIEQWFKKWSEAGVEYAILTAKHTSDFCLWDTKTTTDNSMNSPVKTDIVSDFVKYGRKYGVEPCVYYCLWGGDYNHKDNAKEMLFEQLNELTTNYGDISLYWLDMGCWRPENTQISEIYDFIKERQPNTLVHFNQQIQDGAVIKYFPTDVINGEERIPPEEGHQKIRNIDGKEYYMPFECELCLQCVDSDVGLGYMRGTRWFTYTKAEDNDVLPSKPIDLDILYPVIKQAYQQGASNVILSTGADYTGKVRDIDIEALKEIRKRINEDFGF